MKQNQHKHVVLVGLNYQPARSTGDKNFWVDLITLLARELDRITVISIREHPVLQEEIRTNGCRIRIHYLRPGLLETPDPGPGKGKTRKFWKGGAFPFFLGILEKLAVKKRIIRKLKQIHRQTPFRQIHLMDNFGPGNRSLARLAGRLAVSISVSAVTYMGRNPLVYDNYLKLCYRHFHLTVVPYSAAFAAKLLGLGVRRQQIRQIPWGVMPGKAVDPGKRRQQCREKLGLPREGVLFLWAGLIQQIGEADFLYAVTMAEKARSRGLDAVFCFAFKPETLKKQYLVHHNPPDRIYIRATGVQEFLDCKTAADVFYSPVCNRRSILAPPLTWLELLAGGKPVLTTRAEGAAAAVEEDKTGFAAENDNDLIEKMSVIAVRYPLMAEFCRQKTADCYHLPDIAGRYLSCWLEKEL